MQELAGYLTEEVGDKDHDTMVYGKLSHAVLILSATVLAAGMRQQSQLMQDFLRFLEVAFVHEDPENSTTRKRVKEQLRRFKALLVALAQKEEGFALAEKTIDFDDSATDNKSICFLQELIDLDFIEEQTEEPERVEQLAPVQEQSELEDEPVDEDQQLLM